MNAVSANYWAVIPAAGIGTRMAAVIPKQYLPLHGSTVIECTVQRFLSHPRISGVVVVIAPDDVHWSRTALHGSASSLFVVEGGAERYHSVLNGLMRLAGMAQSHDWVLVHDAARPCLRHDDIDRLIATLADHPVGGLLGVPVADTVKRAGSEGNILETVSRAGLWRALTPQMFRLGELIQALRHVVDNKLAVTDEAAAMELTGHAPRMVEGHADNIKITVPQDLALAELYLRRQEACS